MSPVQSLHVPSSPGKAALVTRNLLIRRLQGLVSLTAADIAALEQISFSACVFGPHVDLIEDDFVSEDAFVVLEGFACHYKRRRSGQRQIMAYVLPGELCDAEAPLQGRMDHAVGTLSTCVVAPIPHQSLADLITRYPNIAQALRVAKLSEGAIAREWIVNLGCRSAIERMAHLFCELMTRLGAVGLAQDGSCALPLTQADLGETLGLSNVHVNRVLQDLRRQGLVEFRGKRLTLLQPQRVREIAEFSPAYLRPGLPIESDSQHAASHSLHRHSVPSRWTGRSMLFPN